MGAVIELAIIFAIGYVVYRVHEWWSRNGDAIMKRARDVAPHAAGFLDAERDVRAPDSTEAITKFLSSEEVLNAELVVAIDCTISNLRSGMMTNKGLSLHSIVDGADAASNPYQCALATVASALLPLDDDKRVAMYKFGDKETKGHSAALIGGGKIDCKSGAQPLLDAYVATIASSELFGPTNFAPVIDLAAQQAREEDRLHVLVILCDGAVSEECWPQTCQSIINASRTAPLSIVIVGLGDGPWDDMQALDDLKGHGQRFDNVHFVEFASTARRGTAHFAAEALKEVPKQRRMMLELNLLNRRRVRSHR